MGVLNGVYSYTSLSIDISSKFVALFFICTEWILFACNQDFILKMGGCRLDDLTFPGKSTELYPGNGQWSFPNLSSEMIIL